MRLSSPVPAFLLLHWQHKCSWAARKITFQSDLFYWSFPSQLLPPPASFPSLWHYPHAVENSTHFPLAFCIPGWISLGMRSQIKLGAENINPWSSRFEKKKSSSLWIFFLCLCWDVEQQTMECLLREVPLCPFTALLVVYLIRVEFFLTNSNPSSLSNKSGYPSFEGSQKLNKNQESHVCFL